MSHNKADLTPALPEPRRQALDEIAEYQKNRIAWYEKQRLKDMLEKDITMFVSRGCTTAFEYLAEAFSAKESSSEETVMGSVWNRILATISDDTLDTGDLTTLRDGVLWVIEVKSQTNTVNSTSLPGELRALRTRVEDIKGRHRASRQPVKAALCVSRHGKVGVDVLRTFESTPTARENQDLNGFTYRYITGPKLWQWLTGHDSEIGLLVPLADIDGSRVKTAREKCLQRLSVELQSELATHKLSKSIDDLVLLRDKII